MRLKKAMRTVSDALEINNAILKAQTLAVISTEECLRAVQLAAACANSGIAVDDMAKTLFDHYPHLAPDIYDLLIEGFDFKIDGIDRADFP